MTTTHSVKMNVRGFYFEIEEDDGSLLVALPVYTILTSRLYIQKQPK